DRRAKLQGAGRGDGRRHQHASLPQALRGASAARAPAAHLRRSDERMKSMNRKWFVYAPLGVVGVAVLVAIGGLIRRHLWDGVLPGLFGWRRIGFGQALGLLLLCRIFFGGLGVHGPGRAKRRRRFAAYWESLTPEERERLRRRVCEGRGGEGPAGDAPH